MPGDILIVLTAGPADGETALAEAVAVATGCDPAAVKIVRRCLRCGSQEHGKPSVRIMTADGVESGAGVHTSLSRTSGLVAVGVAVGGTRAGPIGLDIEHPDLVAKAPLAAALLHPLEQAALDVLPEGARNDRLARLWTVKEAILKATGWGLNIDPAELAVTFAAHANSEVVRLVRWPVALQLDQPPQIEMLDLPRGIVGALAILDAGPYRIRITTV
ncbi:4'-phosphopantetheinyl transferase family protein [Glaciibacter superstes]|uniref:4'-phosphopantetheinyl transferase family protein n=1 Tax=Glaciibacter superstes TaxID=501023 RepID=UPI0003B69C76|nr:4'-phosphopantetheinyl transferase superfamily protein [Glaciibacter superstes]